MLDVDGKRVLVLGLGITGRSAAAFLAARGARVVVADERPDGPAEPPAPGVEVCKGRFPDPAGFDLVVPSPGVPRERFAGAVRAWGDVELASRVLKVPIVAVTGTNGKSTTVRLLEAMLRAAGLRAEAAGNVGDPVLSLVGRPLDVAVVEVSSFQLESVESFRPKVAVWLNTTPDHLDRHGSFEGYVAAKARLLARQEQDDAAVLSFDDPSVRAFAGRCRARVFGFSRRGPLERGGWLEGDHVVLRDEGGLRRIALPPLGPGVHRENVVAALVAVSALDVDPEKAAEALLAFPALPHRTEVISRAGGVSWIDDSKATNPGAAVTALRAQRAPVVWIAGGRDKGLTWDELADVAAGRVRTALLIGEAAPALARALRERVPCEIAGTLDVAVRRAADCARPGDVVLLSPACASYDQFEGFEDRGRRFRALVAAATGEATS